MTPTAASSASGIEWVRQFGTAGRDDANGIAVDASGVYVAGGRGRFTFVRKYDSSGAELWKRQFGTSEGDASTSVAIDASGLYVVGYANTVPDDSSAGSDAFVRKYDPSGSELWTREIATSGDDRARAVSADGSGVYVAGETSGALPGHRPAGGALDAFVRKYDPSGTELWTQQFGTQAGDRALAIVVDESGVYVTGMTAGAFTGHANAGIDFDAFVRKYEPSGTEVWTRQFGSPDSDAATAVAVDASAVYVAGYGGTLPGQPTAFGTDAFVRKYDPEGTELWTRQFGTDTPGLNDEVGTAISVDLSGVYIAGETVGTFIGQTAAGALDAFVRKYDPSGTELWTHQSGTSENDTANAVSVDASGVYVAGATDGALPGQTSAGGTDAFVRRYDPRGLGP